MYAAALKGVLDNHWSVRVNAETHNFWTFRAFIDRLPATAAVFGNSIELKPEANGTRDRPERGELENTV